MDEWTKNIYIHTYIYTYIYTHTYIFEYYSTIIKKEILSFETIWTELDGFILNEMSSRRR